MTVNNIARQLTQGEINALEEFQYVWIQFKTRGVYCLQIIGICKDHNGNVAFMQFDSPNDYIEVDFARHPFKLWSGQPTDEQIEAVKWDD